MAMLRNPKLEKFAQELALGLNEGLSERRAAAIASVRADYPQGTSAAKNAHKRALRADVKARVAELRAPGIKRAEESIGITTEYLLAKLDNLTSFNLDDYLTPVDKAGHRYLDIGRVPRDVLGRIAEFSQETTEGKRKIVRMRIKPYGVIDGIRLMAQIKGLMAPEKRDLTVHATDQMTDDELARIAAGRSPRDPAAPVNS